MGFLGRFFRNKAMVLVSGVGLAVALVLPVVYLSSAGHRHAEAVSTKAESLRNSLQLRFLLLEAKIRGVAGFLSSAENLDPAGYANYVHQSDTSESPQVLRAIAFMPEMERAEIATLYQYLEQNAARFDAQGYPAFELFPTVESEVLYPAILVEPASARRMVFGFDLASSAERMKRVQEALRTGGLTLTSPVTLSQDSDGSPVSLLLFAPVQVDAEVQDQTGFPWSRGVVAASVTPLMVFDEIIADYDSASYRAEFRYGADSHVGLTANKMAAPAGVLERLFSHPHAAPAMAIEFGGRTLQLLYQERVNFTARELVNAFLLFLLGAVASFFASAYLWRLRREADIVSRRLSEKEHVLRESERLIAQSQKQEALGKLVGGVAHDFNNILAVVLGNAELLEEELSPQDTSECVEQIRRAANRGSSLSRQLLSFGRRAMLEPKPESLFEVMASVEGMLRRVLPATIEMKSHIVPGTSPILIDRNQLDTALLNLAINARDAMPNGGFLSITAENIDLETGFARKGEEEFRPGAYVMITVRDTGQGMSTEMRDQAFDPFFTTKAVGQGSGLGLSMVLGFTQQSGGYVRLDSEKNVGTSVRLYFPAHAVAAAPDVSTVEYLTDGDLHILLAEDEAPVRQILKRQLVSAGHRITCCPNGEVALQHLMDGLVPDVLLTDVVMPGAVQGDDLARAAVRLVPSIRTIFITGYAREATIKDDELLTQAVVLQKPVRKSDLFAAIEAMRGTQAQAAE